MYLHKFPKLIVRNINTNCCSSALFLSLMIQDDLYKILDWSRRNNMKLHEQKFELLNHLHSKNSVLPELPFHNETLSYKVSSEIVLDPVKKVRDLGVMVSSDLTWWCEIPSYGRPADPRPSSSP